MALTIKTLMTDSWSKTDGMKSRYWSIYGINVLILLFPVILPALFLGYCYKSSVFPELHFAAFGMFSVVLGLLMLSGFLCVMIFASALYYFCLMHLRGTLMTVSEFMRYALSCKWKLLGAWFLFVIMSGFVAHTASKSSHGLDFIHLLLMLFYVLTVLSILDKRQGVFASLGDAFQYFITHIVLCIFAMLWTSILVLLSIATLGILSIWASPAIRNMYALLYEDMKQD